MKNRLGVGRCCCQGFCEDCCNGNIPAEWDVEINVTDGECTTCDETIAGTYNLYRDADQCSWRYDDFFDVNQWSAECDSEYTPYGDQFVRRYIFLGIRCVSETTYRISALLWLEAKFLLGTIQNVDGTIWEIKNGRHLGRFYYVLDVPFNDFTCDETVNFEVPITIANITTGGQARIPPNPFTGQVAMDVWAASPPTLPIGRVLGNQFNQFYLKPICEPPASIFITAVP